jgi:WD40 repeat protein
MVSASAGGSVRVWNLLQHPHRCSHQYRGHTLPVFSIEVLADGDQGMTIDQSQVPLTSFVLSFLQPLGRPWCLYKRPYSSRLSDACTLPCVALQLNIWQLETGRHLHRCTPAGGRTSVSSQTSASATVTSASSSAAEGSKVRGVGWDIETGLYFTAAKAVGASASLGFGVPGMASTTSAKFLTATTDCISCLDLRQVQFVFICTDGLGGYQGQWGGHVVPSH